MCLAVPGKITDIAGDDHLRSARVDFGGILRDASLLFLPEARVGDYVLVHVGVAIAVVDEAAAQATLGELADLANAAARAPTGRDEEPS